MLSKEFRAFVLGMVVVVAVCLAILLVFGGQRDHPALPKELNAFVFAEKSVATPKGGFKNDAGETLTVADFRGKVVVVNLWATWCAPCVEEMPTLDQLKADMAGKPVEVLAISLDADGLETVRGFFSQNEISHLDLYNDETMALYSEVKAPGLPVTLLVTPDGQVLGQLSGTADWGAPAVEAFLLQLASGQN